MGTDTQRFGQMAFIWILLIMQVHLRTQATFNWIESCNGLSEPLDGNIALNSDWCFWFRGLRVTWSKSGRGHEEEVSQMRCTESEKFEFLCYSLFITSSANSFSLYAPDLIFTSVFFSFILERWNISLHVFTNYLSLHTRDNNVWFFFLCRYQGHHILVASCLHAETVNIYICLLLCRRESILLDIRSILISICLLFF